ncbi:MAG: TetR/AcrR family transcriptional regulator [Lachnospiraceae bacterium]|nr:TetR/AcrR family transcriptional regulator [Lachnospiraceae bacterium]
MNPTQNPSALRSKKVITESLLLLMKKYPYTEITVKQILLETDISRKTFYRNFSSKDDVLDAYIEAILQNYVETLAENENYSFIKMLDTIFDLCEEYKEFLLILRDYGLLYLLLVKLNSIILTEHYKIAKCHSASQRNLINQSLSEYIVSFNIGGVWNVIVRWLENGMKDSADDIKASIVYYLSDIKNIDCREL